ncbi:ribulose-phosphate 3-epimerase, partial [bacterium]|nr:ribulose-phosphate 3-epimerase [bacterium]
SNVLTLEKTLQQFDRLCNGYHLDVMDDHFVPNLTWGPVFINAIRQATPLPLHIHLMVDNPEMWISRLKLQSGDSIIFHYEAIRDHAHAKLIIDAIKDSGIHAGIAINPNTAPEKMHELLPMLDMILLMTVYPGFSGQTFIPDVLNKIPTIRKMQQVTQNHAILCLDGGINATTLPLVREHHIQHAAIATAIFGQPDPVTALKQLYASCQ